MYAFLKILKEFFLPAGMLFGFLAVSWFFLLFKKKEKWQRNGKVLLLLAILFLYALATDPVSGLLTSSLEKKFIPVMQRDPLVRYIVVLGGGSLQKEGFPVVHQLSKPAVTRALEGHRLWKLFDKEVPLIVSGGNADPFNKKTTEGVLLKSFLVGLGVPESQIFSESKSRDTYENIILTEKIIRNREQNKKHGEKKPRVVLVTSAIHLTRASLIARHQKWDFLCSPADFISSSEPRSVLSYMPQTNNFCDSFQAIHEYLGIAFYKLRGRL